MKHFLQTVMLILLATTFSYSQISESFEGDFPPAGWAAFPGESGESDAEWDQQDDYESSYHNYGFAHTGDYSAISSFDFEGETQGWLVTPQFTPTDDNHNLYFFQRQAYEEDYYSTFSVWVSTGSQTNIADFTMIEEQTEEDVPTYFVQHIVDLSAYIGSDIYVAFVHTQDDDDEYYIDDVTTIPIEPPGPTLNPVPADGATDVAITNAQTSEIDFSWSAPETGGDMLQYNFYIGLEENNLHLLGHPDGTASPRVFHFNTTYYWKAAAVNMGGETSDTFSFTTVPQPVVVGSFTIDFENEGFIPDGCDQLATNQKWWTYADSLSGHIGNAGDAAGTTTESGGYFAYIDDSKSPTDAQNTTFTTPFVGYVPMNSYLSFYLLSNNEGEAGVNFRVEAGNETIGWSTIYTKDTINTNGWEKIEISSFPIENFATIQFRFIVDEGPGGGKDDIAIDDIFFNLIEDVDNQNDLANLQYYPNPVNDVLVINSDRDITSVEIFDMLGRLVIKTYPNTTNTVIDTHDLQSGNYMVKVNRNTAIGTFKLMKK